MGLFIMNFRNDIIEKLNTLSIEGYNKNYTFLGEGIARRVYALNDNLVVKVAKNEDGYYQNFVEEYVFKHVDSKFLKYLCPIYYSNSRIIIMHRAIPYKAIKKNSVVSIKSLRKEPTAINDIQALTKNFFLYAEDIYSPTSWGQVFNNNVLIDYGCTSDLGDYFYNFLYTLYAINSLGKNKGN